MEQIVVHNLTKIFGSQRAVDDISFVANKGEILGFLGPNGAGKSTTMKMICAFLEQNDGEIHVCGENTLENPLEVKKKIGYLPESNPLYLDMYVREYLHWLCKIHSIKNSKERINEIIEMVGLELEQNKLIGTLSKGYKQRVGLAQAIIHDPEILILDEPTSGLDPNQLVEIRALIKTLGKEKTVIFSSHIMQEVQAICDRVVIINQGKIVANQSIEQLGAQATVRKKLFIAFEKEIGAEQIEKLSGVQNIKKEGDHSYEISFDESLDLRLDLFDLAVKSSNRILELRPMEESIESIFGRLTQAEQN